MGVYKLEIDTKDLKRIYGALEKSIYIGIPKYYLPSLEKNLKKHAPIESGDLRDSITVRLKDGSDLNIGEIEMLSYGLHLDKLNNWISLSLKDTESELNGIGRQALNYGFEGF